MSSGFSLQHGYLWWPRSDMNGSTAVPLRGLAEEIASLSRKLAIPPLLPCRLKRRPHWGGPLRRCGITHGIRYRLGGLRRKWVPHRHNLITIHHDAAREFEDPSRWR